MPTLPYFTTDGTRVPGVTTVNNNLGWSKDGLKHWAWKLGTEGKDYRNVLKEAADAGTVAHAMVEAHINGVPFGPHLVGLPYSPEAEANAKTAFSAFRRWERGSRLNIVATEVYLVDDDYRFGGCIDAIGLVDNEEGEPELALIDWKTSDGTYADHIIQIRAYGYLWEKLTGMPLTGGYHLCRFAKQSGSFSHKWWPQDGLEDAWKVFTWLRAIHEKKWVLEKLAK
jgi:hypothetical protein